MKPTPQSLYFSTLTLFINCRKIMPNYILDVLPALQAQNYTFTIKLIVCSTYWITISFTEITQIPQLFIPFLALNPYGKMTAIISNSNLITTVRIAVSQAHVGTTTKGFQNVYLTTVVTNKQKSVPRYFA